MHNRYFKYYNSLNILLKGGIEIEDVLAQRTTEENVLNANNWTLFSN